MRLLIILTLLLIIPLNVFAENEKGEELYKAWCAQCHGYEGEGDGYSADYTFPAPRDFTLGAYKFRTTPTGDPPTDEDLVRSIRKGNPGTSMPAWERFSDDEVRAIVEYVKEFAPDIFEFETDPIEIKSVPVTPEIIEKGKELFKLAKCIECHGDAGRGNGKKGWEENFQDDWGNTIYPANYTHPWELRNGSSLEDIYRTITTGLNGTPMTSYQDSLSDDERWSLAHFIYSLQRERNLGISLRVTKVQTLPASVDDPVWMDLAYLDLPMGGQIMFETRNFTPTITNVRVRGVFTDTDIAVMLEWVDKKPDTGDDDLPPDAVRVQFPSKISGGSEKPYFFMGDKRHPVTIWLWEAGDNTALEYVAKGKDNLIERAVHNVKASGSYTDGLYRILFTRSLISDDKEDTVFETGRFIPVAVTLYDGRDEQEGNRGVISAWYYLMLEPPTPLKVFVFPPFVTIAVFGVGFALHRKLRGTR